MLDSFIIGLEIDFTDINFRLHRLSRKDWKVLDRAAWPLISGKSGKWHARLSWHLKRDRQIDRDGQGAQQERQKDRKRYPPTVLQINQLC